MVITTINNTLCRVVEPEPLTETATFPCVVRLIQDDSPMGRYNLKLRNTTLEPLVVTGIAKDIGVVTHLVPHPHFSCECYEIIGYPVDKNSAEWAWYQWCILDKPIKKPMAGEYVDNPYNPSMEYIFGYPKEYWKDNSERWMKRCRDCNMLTGWRIDRSPNPLLLAGAEVGDICTRRDGKISCVTKIDDERVLVGTSDNIWYYLDGRGTTRDKPHDIVRIEKPRPAPKFANIKVNNWVETSYFDLRAQRRTLHYERVVEVHSNGNFVVDNPLIYGRTEFDSEGYGPLFRKAQRIVDPSDVPVDVGVNGPVRRGKNESCYEVLIPKIGWVTYKFNETEPLTANLVRELLMAQEEK